MPLIQVLFNILYDLANDFGERELKKVCYQKSIIKAWKESEV